MTAVPGAKDPAGRGEDMLRGREREREGEPDGAGTGEGAGVPDGTEVRQEPADGADGVAAAGEAAETEPAPEAAGGTEREAAAYSAGSAVAARDAAPEAEEGTRGEEAAADPEAQVEAGVPAGEGAEDEAAESAEAEAGGDSGGAALPGSGADDDRAAGSRADTEAEPRATAEDEGAEGAEGAGTAIEHPAGGEAAAPEAAGADGAEPDSAPTTDRRSDKDEAEPDTAATGDATATDQASGPGKDDADEAPPEASADDAPDTEAGAARVPAWARGDDESDNERTSTFVPLKPLEPREAGAPRAGKAPEGREPGRDGDDQRTVHLRAPERPEGQAPKPEKGPAQPQAPQPEGAQAAPAEPAPTTEQPLPPLDLLAQLTNTPPPPETTTRTLVRRVKVWTPVVLLLASVFAGVQALRPVPTATLTTEGAAASATVDGRLDLPWPAAGQGAVRVQGAGDVGTFGMQKPVPTASVAKVMTAYVILRDHPLKKNEDGPRIEVDAQAVQDGTAEHESRIEGLTAGSTFSQQDMLKMLMIPSGNNVARLLARWDGGGDQGAFVAKMNAAAKELGMTSTRYTDPSGLDPKTVSTATDQLKLAEAVMKFDAFRAIVALPNARIEGLPAPINNNNDNLLLSGLSIKGIKTGSSSAAGGALMWAAYKTVGDKTPLIIGTLMDQHVDGPDPDAIRSLGLVKDNSKKIIEAVRNALTAATVVKKGQVVGYVDDHLGTRTPLVATQDVTAVAVPGQKLSLALALDGSGKLPAEAPAGTVVATLTVGTGPGAPTVPVAVQHDLEAPSFGARLTRLG
ncbi:serine hydrolase [Streptomyces sp. NPDC086023]|uniref:serine hydrolase n=1 Tax=Streptomyces sp. NPDC086023 TaxID=3365746 RepID=UPI0037D0AB25